MTGRRSALPSILGLVGTDDRQEIVSFQEGAGGIVACLVSIVCFDCLREEIRAASDVVVNKVPAAPLLAEILTGVRPEQITHQAVGRRLSETVEL